VETILQGITARYAEPGFIVYTRADGALLAVPFDVDALEVTGPSTPLLEGILTKLPAVAEFTIAQNGSLMYLTGEAGSEQLVWVERDGGERSIDPALEEDFTSVALAPQGGRIALSYTADAGQNIWIYDIAQATLSRLTFQGEFNQRPEWMPGGSEITFVSNAGGIRQLFAMPADGSGSARSLFTPEVQVQEASWSRDGRYLVYRAGPGGSGTQRDILYLERGDTTPRPFLATEFDELNPKFAPDGRWLAYVSNESGRDEVYVRPFPGPGGRWQISTEGGTEPLWSHDGRELFYRSEDAELVSAEVTIGESFSVGTRTVLFSVVGYNADRNHTMYDISPDDQSFLMVKQTGGSREVVVVLNWFTEVLQRIER
jgi:serine/threonine-protein kinase